jgi:Flp pilus assembly protein TadG
MPSSNGQGHRRASRPALATNCRVPALNPVSRFSRNRGHDERGATLILVALSMTLLLAAAGFSVDLGRAVVVNRSLQLVADNAALDAGRYLTIPETVSLPNSSDNLIVHADNSATNNGSTAAIAV